MKIFKGALHALGVSLGLATPKEEPVSPRKYALKGEWVTCAQGHKIVQLERDVQYGEGFDPTVFVNWQQACPVMGEVLHPCAECGGNFYAGMQFHFNDGWRV